MRLALLALLVALPAHADDGAEEEDPEPNPVSVRAKLSGTTVELTARFALETQDVGVSLGNTWIPLPSGAMVTAATATVNGTSHPLRLVGHEDAEKAFDAIAVKPPARDRTSAIKLEVGSGTLTVDLAVPRRSRLVLELGLTMPACFYRDARYVSLPEAWYAKLASPPPAAHADEDALDDHCGVANDDSKWLAFPARELARKPAGEARIGVIGGRLPLGERHLARIEVDVSSQLAQVPDDLHTAIVIDRSRSVSAELRESQRAIVASYLRQVPPHSRVQVIAYARRAEALLPAWMSASASAPRLDREIRALAPRNGSNVDEAIAEAGRWLARARGTRRLVVFGDDRWAERIARIPAESYADHLPPGTLVHAVSLLEGDELRRDDDLPLAPLAKATAGISVTGGVDVEGRADAAMLVRPISIDKLAVHGQGWEALEVPDSTCEVEANVFGPRLGEGTSCTWWGIGKPVAGPLAVEGYIWGTKITRVVRPDPSQARSLARILSASRGLSDEQLQELVDHAAFALNSVWSMIATWGGSGGYEDLGGLGSLSTSGFSCCGGSSHDSGTGGFGTVGRIELDLRKQIEAATRHCRRDTHASIRIETTLQEIVDVVVALPDRDEQLHACLTEAVWDASLAIANAPGHAISRVQL